MSYRFLWKQVASKALSSAMAKGLLAMNSDELWERVGRNQSFSPEQLATLRSDIEERLQEVLEQGSQERELVAQVAESLMMGLLRRGGGQ
jgi:cytochrome P450